MLMTSGRSAEDLDVELDVDGGVDGVDGVDVELIPVEVGGGVEQFDSASASFVV